MKQTPLLAFESSAFVIAPGEDDATNPGIYGKALAGWLSEQLRIAGFSPRAVIAEDFGWCVPLESTSHSVYVACASMPDRSGTWRVFAFAERGLVPRLLTPDKSAESLATVFAALKRCLESAPIIHDLRVEDDA